MDFDLNDAHEAVRDLADRILREHAAPERLSRLEDGDWFDRDAWAALAAAGLLGIALPERAGGAGMGFLAVHLLLEAVGRTVAHVPVWETLLAAHAVADADPDADVLRAVVAGDTVLTLALQDEGASVREPTTTARPAGTGYRLDGTKILVPCASLAGHVVVSAVDPDGVPRLYLVAAADVQVTPHVVSTDVPHGRVELRSAPGVALGAAGGGGLAALIALATAGIASLQSGVCQAAVRLAADYTSQREQFGRPVATFQAVSQRVADAFIETQCARLTALQAAWRLDEGVVADDEIAIAKFWAAEAGHRVLHACQHVHGGVGVDREYPLHRYLLRTKQYEFALGSARDHLHALGAGLAAEPA